MTSIRRITRALSEDAELDNRYMRRSLSDPEPVDVPFLTPADLPEPAVVDDDPEVGLDYALGHPDYDPDRFYPQVKVGDSTRVTVNIPNTIHYFVKSLLEQGNLKRYGVNTMSDFMRSAFIHESHRANRIAKWGLTKEMQELLARHLFEDKILRRHEERERNEQVIEALRADWEKYGASNPNSVDAKELKAQAKEWYDRFPEDSVWRDIIRQRLGSMLG